MERQIKFRGLRVDNNEWVYGYYYKLTESQNYIMKGLHQWNVIPETVGQFTGLKDVDCCEIYEGDLLSLCGKIIGNRYESLDERESYIIIPEITGRDWQSAYKKILDITQRYT